MNPRLNIDLKKFKHNAEFLAGLCKKHGLSLAAVTKVFCADKRMVEVLASLPIEYLADSRLENIRSYPDGLKQKTMLLRLPAPAGASDVVKYADISLNSEIETINQLGIAASLQGKSHGVVIMVDLGDLREGIYHNKLDEIFQICDLVLNLDFLELTGIGTNLTCYGSVLPSEENLSKLVEIAKHIEEKFGITLPIISGGNSSSLNILAEGKSPAKINNLRLGESIACGLETANGEPFAGMVQNVIVLEASIIEIARKPSMPEGITNINAFGEKVTYTDRGEHVRAIVAVGRQDVPSDGLAPLDAGVEIVGASSDHLIVDITKASTKKVGDCLKFSLSYGAILACFTSRYVDRSYIE